MTKVRPPVSIEAALSRIAGAFPDGYNDLAIVLDRSADTIRDWGNVTRPGEMLLKHAIALDIAYQRAGGEGRPLFELYALQCEVAREEAFASEIAIAQRACVLIREGAQANEAVVRASLPSAGPRDRTQAIRELEDVVREATAAIAELSRGASPREPPT